LSAESNRPLRVLQVIPSLSPVHGGPSAALPMIERALGSLGVEVETLTTDDDGRGRLPRASTPIRENGVLRHYLPRTTRAYQYAAGLGRWMQHNARRFDLVHVHSVFNHVPMAATRQCRRLGIPYIVRPCGILSAYGMGRRPLVKTLSLRLVEAPNLRAAAAIHVTSAAERADIEALIPGPLRFAEIPLGIEAAMAGDTRRWLERHPRLAAAGLRLLFLSRIDPKKNLEALIDALALLPAEVRLCVCGEGETDYRRTLEQRASAAGVAERIIWAGHVSGTDKADAFAAADLFILPSFAENFGIAAAEALHAGLPVIAGRGVALSSDIAAAGAGLAVAPDGGSIAAAIRQLGESAPRQSAARAARRLAEDRYSPAGMGTKLLELYRKICPA
jgi:glycosyltransferase involved in cell wall biosynthesis